MEQEFKLLAELIREFGPAGTTLALAIYVIRWQSEIIRKNTAVLSELCTLLKHYMGHNEKPNPDPSV